MFERYTEKARRTVFFARYEASQFGSQYIETEHLLLGLLRENRSLAAWIRTITGAGVEDFRREVEQRSPRREKLSASVDLPMSDLTKRVLVFGAEEAERLSHRHIGTEHLFLGLLREEGCIAAVLLQGRGVTLEKARAHVGQSKSEEPPVPRLSSEFITIHSSDHPAVLIRKRVQRCRQFHWEKKTWAPVDVVVRHGTGAVSFDLSLAGKAPELELVKGGWKQDECAVCMWKFSDQLGPEHATGFTNGRDWICEECHEKFWARPDFVGGRLGEIT